MPIRTIIVRLIKRSVPRGIDQEYHQILTDHSTYYRYLEDAEKSRFRLRLFKLLNVMAFGSAKMGQVTREMRVVIGSAIIEITFGLRNYLPTRFTTVEVLPYRYMYPGYGEPFLGHIDFNQNKIYFSWDDVQKGYLVPDDAVNVALHEMAHVLEAENGINAIFSNFFDRVEWNEWAQQAFNKMHIIRNNRNKFLKNYGGINMTEMFAVCIEAFFEQPQEFRQALPVIYQKMVGLLNQDTAAMWDRGQRLNL